MRRLTVEEYLGDPCGMSSLPFRKTEYMEIPKNVTVVRDDEFKSAHYEGKDEPYFKVIHHLKQIIRPVLPPPFEIIRCGTTAFSVHINECYSEEGVSSAELDAYTQLPGYDPELWIAVYDPGNGRIIATGIAEADRRIGEGVLEWIQVSPDYRRKGLGRFIVNELLYRMRNKADFVTVSGKVNSPCEPLALYLSCGFTDPVIWHVIIAEFE